MIVNQVITTMYNVNIIKLQSETVVNFFSNKLALSWIHKSYQVDEHK